jgi:hypothetical protein
VVAGMLASLTGATRNLGQTQACASNLRQLYTGLAAYVAQYNSYPPHSPYPQYMASQTINGLYTGGFDPNIGFIMTHGLGLVPPATDTATGHFKWYGTPYADLPDVCKCPALPPALLDPANPELDPGSLETNLYQYALSYMTSGTCRAATPVTRPRGSTTSSQGGRNPPIPDPRNGNASAQQADNNCHGSPPYVWVMPHDPNARPSQNSSAGTEVPCWIQATNPAEVQSPGRTYYLADSRDYGSQAGSNSGWGAGYGNQLFISARHFGYSNVMYLDGRVTRDGQRHIWIDVYDPATGQLSSTLSRFTTFNTNLRIANIITQMPLMPVLMVKGWEYFFDATGIKAQ